MREAMDLPSSADPFYDPSCWSTNKELEWMGYTVRSPSWRFTEWYAWNQTSLCPIRADNAPMELYDHRNDTALFDPDVAEYRNVARAKENLEVVSRLRQALREHTRFCG